MTAAGTGPRTARVSPYTRNATATELLNGAAEDTGLRHQAIELVRTMIVLAHNLGLRVVAEGIESLEQLALLRGLDCDLGQGYHIARPMAPDDAILFVTLKRP